MVLSSGVRYRYSGLSLSRCGGLVFSFFFVDFLVFFLLIFKCFCFVSLIGLFLTLQFLSFANLSCLSLSCFVGLSLSDPLSIVVNIVF